MVDGDAHRHLRLAVPLQVDTHNMQCGCGLLRKNVVGVHRTGLVLCLHGDPLSAGDRKPTIKPLCTSFLNCTWYGEGLL